MAKKRTFTRSSSHFAGVGGHASNTTFKVDGLQPKEKCTAFKTALKWAIENEFIRMVIKQKLAHFNYGLVIKIGGKAPKDHKEERLARGYVRDVWLSRLRFSNVVSFWRADEKKAPFTLDIQRCDYCDDMGYTELKYLHGMSSAQIDRKDDEGRYIIASPAERQRLKAKPYLTFSDDNGFLVLKDEAVGSGFGWPELYSVFKPANQWESMEVGECAMAHHCRTAERRHKGGHETRYGLSAGTNKNFLNAKTREDIQKFYKGVMGAIDTAVNYDQTVEFPYPKMEVFDARKWDGMKKRFSLWAGPVAYMIEARGLTPFLMELFKTEAIADRKDVGPYLEHVMSEAYGKEVEISWSLKCFRDSRLFTELLKFGVQQGPISLTSLVHETGFDPVVEGDQKEREAKTPKRYTPLFDAAHGNHPGGKKAGKPPETVDKE